MKLVRMATPGMVRRMRSISFRKISPDAPRFVEPYAGPSGHRRRFFGRAIGRLDRIRAYRYTMQRAKRWSSVHTW